MKNCKKLVLLLFVFLCYHQSFSQKEQLQVFEKFMDHSWEGHYVNSEDSALVHHLKWEYGLDSSYVKQTKLVPEVNFKMEYYYYWDYEMKQVSFITFVNKAMISKGAVTLDGEMLVLNYKTYFSSGASESRQTFNIDSETRLVDYFYRKRNDQWVKGHLIRYK